MLNRTILCLMVLGVGAAMIPSSAYAAGAIGEGFAIGDVLDESWGWFIVVGLGAVFAIVITIETKIEERYLGVSQTSEWFNTAGRVIKTGLTAAAIVSAWTWAATLLQSSTVAYQYGISGPFWYAAGASIQVLLFGILAIELKRKAPNAHTFLEIIRARYGEAAHRVFLVFALMTNMIVTAMLLLGGAAVVNGLTGMDISLAAFLIPIGVMIYTLVGGLKATFVADYMHTIIIFIVILTFVGMVYFVSPVTGGVEGMFEKLTEAAAINPVEGNAAGAYLTMASLGGLIFGIINIVGNFGTVFVDQAYWQRAIAARPQSTVKGFLLGGACWFAIPFTLATTMGLTAVALGVDLTPEEVQLGLTVPAAASVLMGEVGAVLVLTMLFMAVTSAGSAELIAVSSLITYDVYRTYKNPNASGKKLLKVSRYTIIGFGIGMGGLAVILLSMGLSLGFVYLAMGVLIGSAVIPIALTITWKRTNKYAATAGAIIGLIVALITWTGVASAQYGEVSLASLGDNYSMLFGNIAGILTGGAIAGFGSLVSRTKFEWADMKERIKLVDISQAEMNELEVNEATLKKAFRFSLKGGGLMTLILIIAWPMPLFFANYVFDIGFYSLWVGISVVWVSVATFFIVGLPIIEARQGIAKVARGRRASPAEEE
ncbi:MAG: sodium/solute symporter [Cenarchaeum sp. SB0665_bin_23]|nr:sodium/solute symporter [Cenarchaeum sp. SB0667_bin_13]MXY38057.1 sodium/solute symporter [Cenarchaeum sp. SB0664_bin_35]MXY60698.1 sodium/solute symporter [Cenarchaeum sp. SB0665_bin_23]MXZ93798.1 sodium/solute symporter [Cenarchaeum sp. SB0666_bin_15]MYC80244.1 sodium/solute symporter [Cenarchaeum sp. SB0661_bin_35]MYD58932.1 sodium/solute symporter [Cenarchaeum sp. SB0678_bin_8]MYG33551.1 sodium/solute symporter [Cenarchaeum sp. SB0677_bin_16]MYI52353.1 sodium/solute symporter [Cenarch